MTLLKSEKCSQCEVLEGVLCENATELGQSTDVL